MNMKDHILAALQEQYQAWETILAGLDESRLTTPLEPGGWSPKDIMAHLMAWQQRSIARLEAAHADREPQFPAWDPLVDPEDYGVTDQINTWIYSYYRDWTWLDVFQAWRDGFNHFLALGTGISEPDLLSADRYPWLEGYSMAFILEASYDHHQEHYEKLVEWL
jgi:hypothetical protein